MTQEELAAHVVDSWDMDTLIDYAVQQLTNHYKANPDHYKEDLANETDY